jgi:hypothetical protein
LLEHTPRIGSEKQGHIPDGHQVRCVLVGPHPVAQEIVDFTEGGNGLLRVAGLPEDFMREQSQPDAPRVAFEVGGEGGRGVGVLTDCHQRADQQEPPFFGGLAVRNGLIAQADAFGVVAVDEERAHFIEIEGGAARGASGALSREDKNPQQPKVPAEPWRRRVHAMLIAQPSGRDKVSQEIPAVDWRNRQ